MKRSKRDGKLSIKRIFRRNLFDKIRKYKDTDQFIIVIILILFLPIAAFAKSEITRSKEEYAAKQKIEQKVNASPSLKSPSPKQSSIPISNNITCNIHARCGGGVKYMTQSQCDSTHCCFIDEKCGGGGFLTTKTACDNSTCCQIGDKWVQYSDRNKCIADQKTNNQIKVAPNNYIPPSYVAPTYVDNTINCSVYYPSSGQTYYYQVTPETCTEFQNNAQSNYQDESLSETVYVAPTYSVEDCQRDVTDKYRSLMQSSGCYFPCPDIGDCGSSSVCDAYWRSFQQDYNSCGG
jgi:hypothetical protein